MLGGEACMWNSAFAPGSNMEPTIWPNAAAMAEQLWSPTTEPVDQARTLTLSPSQLTPTLSPSQLTLSLSLSQLTLTLTLTLTLSLTLSLSPSQHR